MRTLLILTIMVILTMSAAPAWSQDSFSPWDFNSGKTAPAKSADADKMTAGAKALSWGVHFYRETISQVDGERCKMYPSCSAYSLEAIKKHGFFLGYVMTADRLIHESNEMDNAPKIKLKNGKERYYDPVDANDFWWSGK
jgi:putative component of membrane protein insertase Oxa1/YidC/SpoIIIJ protein YidD